MISDKLGWEYYSTGVVQRGIAQAMGITTLELNHIAETDKSIDEKIDGVFASLDAKDNVVIDSRMAWHFLPNSFHVRLIVSPEEAANRILRDTTRDAEKYASSLVAIRDIEARTVSERSRYKNTYKVDVAKIVNYDLIIDTEFLSPETVTELIIAAYTMWKVSLPYAKNIISPKIAIPSNSIRHLDTLKVSDYTEVLLREGFVSNDISSVLYYRGHHIILDRHELFCAAVRSNMPVVPVQLVEKLDEIGLSNLSVERFAADSVRLHNIYDWEDACGLKYATYPSWAV